MFSFLAAVSYTVITKCHKSAAIYIHFNGGNTFSFPRFSTYFQLSLRRSNYFGEIALWLKRILPFYYFKTPRDHFKGREQHFYDKDFLSPLLNEVKCIAVAFKVADCFLTSGLQQPGRLRADTGIL